MGRHRAVAVGLVVVLAALFAPASSGAVTPGWTDNVNDAADGTYDITRVDADYDRITVTVKITTRSTLPALGHSSWSVNGGSGRAMYVNLQRGIAGNTTNSISIFGDRAWVYDQRTEEFRCNPSRTVSGNSVTVSFPATCIDTPNNFDLNASTSDGSDTVDVIPNFDSYGVTLDVRAGGGYWALGSDGGVFTYGDAQFYGSTGNIRLNKPVVGMDAMPRGDGYRFVATDGGVFSYGSAGFFGSTGNITLNKPVVGMASTPSGNGYWLVASDGGIFAFGDAQFHGSTGAITLNQPIVGMAPTKSGNGYWLVASDGGIFAFGDAQFYGSAGNQLGLDAWTGIARSETGDGYWLVGLDGRVFAYGDAPFRGDWRGQGKAAVGIQAVEGNAYRIVGAAGQIETMGAPVDYGDSSRGGIHMNAPIVGGAES